MQRRAIAQLARIRAQYETPRSPMVISGCLGPRGDAYRADARMSAPEAQAYHATQVAVFADTEADMVAAFAITYAEEAIGIVRAARANALPVAISFTVETDGRLPSGEALADAILRADAETDGYAIESDTLDSGDPDALGQDYLALRSQFPALSILGGCCGTDHRHVEAVCRAVRVPA